MPRVVVVIAILALVVFLGSAAMLTVYSRGGASPPQRAIDIGGNRIALVPDNDNALAGLAIPEFELVNQNNAPVTRADLLGKVTIIDFFFTHCPFVCPMLTANLQNVAERLRGTPVRFMSFSVDPNRDTPERLREYAESHGIDLTRWSLLTGDPAVVRRIATDGLKFALDTDASRSITLPDGSTMSNIQHPQWYALIGPDGSVRGLYPTSMPEELERLERDARALAGKQ